jgi:hypothetical protein
MAAEKPPCLAHNQVEREQMRDWVIAKLDAAIEEESDARNRLLLDPNVQACMHKIIDKQLAELRSEEHALAEAHRGNMEPLRKLRPQYEPFLRPKKLKRGEHFEKASKLQLLVKLARADVRRIKELWKAEYKGKRNRLEGQITAVEIAAERWGISVNAILK